MGRKAEHGLIAESKVRLVGLSWLKLTVPK